VADIMSRDVVSLSPEMDLRAAAATLAEHQISGAPVCSQEGRLVGTLSATDLVERQATSEGPAHVGDVMTPAVVSIGAGDSVQRAIEAMAFEGVHRLIVVEEGRLVGIVTSMDVLRELAGYSRADDRVIAVAPPGDAPTG
jgi:predicted transcriptional regulator